MAGLSASKTFADPPIGLAPVLHIQRIHFGYAWTILMIVSSSTFGCGRKIMRPAVSRAERPLLDAKWRRGELGLRDGEQILSEGIRQ